MPFGTRYTDTLNLPYLKFHALTLFGPGGGGGGGADSSRGDFGR